MKKTLQLFLKLGLSVGIFMMFGLTAFAAAPAGTMAMTSQSVATSSSGQALNTVTVTSNLTEITAANDIFIRIPSTVNARFDTTDTTVTIVQSATGVTSTTVSFPVNAKTVKLDVTTNFGSGENVQIGGLTILGDAVTSSTALVWAVDNTTEGSATFSATSSAALAVTATDAAATLTLADATVGGSGTATLTLTLSVAMANTDTVTFTAPAQLDVSGLSTTAVTGTLEGVGQITCTASGQVVTCTIDGASAAAGAGLTIIFPADKVEAAYIGTADITDVAINDTSATPAGADINADTSVAVTDTTIGDLTATNVEPAVLSLSSLSQNTISFTTTASIPNLGSILISYPTDWNVSGANGLTAANLSGLDGTWTASVSGQVITLTQTGGGASAAGAKSFTINNILTPPYTGSGGTYIIRTRHTASGTPLIEENSAVTADTIIGKTQATVTIGAVTGVTVTDNATGGLLITWTDPSGDQSTHIQILRGIAPLSVDGSPYATVLKGVKQFVDTGVMAGDEVTYQLRAVTSSRTGTLADAVSFVVGSTLAPEEEPAAVEPVTVNLTAVAESGQSGTATLTEADGQVTIEVNLTGATGTQQSHIHSGTCSETGDVAHALTDLVDGASTTVLEMTLAELEAEGPSYINAHDAADAAVFTACGDLYAAATQAPEEVAAPEATVEVVTPDETGTVVDETTVQGTGESAYATVSGGTTFTTADGAPYTGTFIPPTKQEQDLGNPPEGAQFASDVYKIGSEEGDINASQPVTVYLPVKAGFVADMLKVYKIFKLGSDQPSATCTVVTSGEATLFRCELTSFSDYVVLEFEAPVEEEGTGAEEEDEEEEVAEAPFTDTKTHWSKDYVADLYAKGIVSGKTTTKYAPDDAVTRAEFTKIIVGAFSIDMVSTTGSFTDISGHWGAKYIEAAKAAGVISGYSDKTFKPDAQINRAEALKILLEAADVSLTAAAADFPDVKTSDWFAKYVNYAAANEIVKGYADGTFGPNRSITRGEVAKIVSLMIAE